MYGLIPVPTHNHLAGVLGAAKSWLGHATVLAVIGASAYAYHQIKASGAAAAELGHYEAALRASQEAAETERELRTRADGLVGQARRDLAEAAADNDTLRSALDNWAAADATNTAEEEPEICPSSCLSPRL